MDIFREWDRLCEEHDATRDEYFAALSIVERRFAAIEHGESTQNPTEDELQRLEATRKVWEQVMEKMEDYIGKQTRRP